MNVKEKLKETSQQLQSLISSVPGGIGIFELKDQNLTYRYFNDGLAALLGFTHEEYAKLIEHTAVAMVYPEDLPVLMQAVADVVANPRPNDSTTSEFRMIRKDQSLAWIFLSASIMSVEADRIVFSAVFIDISDLKEAQNHIEVKNRELRYHSEHDHLTGLYNREMFCLMTEEMMKEEPEEAYVIVRFDIERFKMINELFGSETGDKVLCCIASMLECEVGTHGVYGRLEADHFALCLREKDMDINKLMEAHEACFQTLNLNYNITICAGIIRIDDCTLSVEQMCERANMALATIKGRPFQHYAFYEDAMLHSLVQEQSMVNEMHQALEDGQFVFFLQPIFDAVTETPVSAEALIRWIHPTKGMISPGLFVPLFERNGFIAVLDRYIWEQVCRYLSEAVKRGEPVVPVSVNVSRVDLFTPNLCEKIIQMVDGYGLDHGLIKFEITESAYMDDSCQLQNLIRDLQKNGFKVLMDDFGSGYSSLNMLKDTPIDILKIDMRFLEDFSIYNRSGNVLNSVIRMAKLLNMNIVAEGVETREQLSFLKGAGCDWIQGYYFSKPLPLRDFRQLLKEYQTKAEEARQADASSGIVISEPGHSNMGEPSGKLEFTWESMQRELDRQRHYFEVVRVVNPVKTSVCGAEQGECNAHACHAIWQKDARCGNCISMKALENKTRVNKLEYSEKGLFFVIAQHITVEGQDLVMELVSPLEDGYVDNVFDRDLLLMKLDDLNHQLVSDELTGVFNRRYIDQHVPLYLKNGSMLRHDVGIAMVDIDYLKEINDAFGHIAGDAAICRIATLLKENIAISKGDFVARYGGDEFLVLCRGITPETFEKRLIHVMELIGGTTLEDYPEIHLGISVGMANLSEYPGESAKQMIEHADRRLYEAKKCRHRH